MFPVVTVPPDAAELSEQMGTKFKFWYLDDKRQRTLFKEGRPGTGENWAEKLASEFAELLGIPHAAYELACWKDHFGVITPSLVAKRERLVHGNELIEGRVIRGGADENVRYYQQRSHIATRAFQLLKKNSDIIAPPRTYQPINGVDSALGVFVGYLLFDAWIANQDRHSENWGIIIGGDGRLYLAPSYDHGSSLGRNETDDKRHQILTTKDKGRSMAAYVCRARSAFYPPAPPDVKVKAYTTTDLFEVAAKADPVAAMAWQGKLATIEERQLQEIIGKVPAEHMSDIARQFTLQLLLANIDRLLSLKIQ
jgi:hypothetical protein